jgi:hypothetical protein
MAYFNSSEFLHLFTPMLLPRRRGFTING